MKNARIHRAAFFALFLTLLGTTSLEAMALIPGEEKNLRGRLGVGFTNQIATLNDRTIPAVSTKYFLNKSAAAGLALGFDTRQGDSAAAVGFKGYKNVFLETNLSFYLGLGFAYVNHHGSKFQGNLFIGSEFFFDRLPSLGLSFEAGIRGDSATGSFAVRTTGDSFLTAGMHFYL